MYVYFQHTVTLTKLRSLKSDWKQKGHCHSPVISFLIGLARSRTSRIGLRLTIPTTVHVTSFPSYRLSGVSPVSRMNFSSPLRGV